MLETKGLVEVQHSNPQKFRAVSIDEAAETLRREYESRTEVLQEALRGIEPVTFDAEADVTHEVWALSGTTAIRNRTQQLIDEAEDELVLVIGDEAAVTEGLIDHLQTAQGRGVDIVIGTVAEVLREVIQDALPNAEVFVSGLEWLNASGAPDDETEISRLLLVDRSSILASSAHGSREGEMTHEQAVFGRGFDNGLVAIVRRLMATGLLPVADPGIADPDGE